MKGFYGNQCTMAIKVEPGFALQEPE